MTTSDMLPTRYRGLRIKGDDDFLDFLSWLQGRAWADNVPPLHDDGRWDMTISNNRMTQPNDQESILANWHKESPYATDQDWAITTLLDEFPRNGKGELIHQVLSHADWSYIFGTPVVEDNFVAKLLTVRDPTVRGSAPPQLHGGPRCLT